VKEMIMKKSSVNNSLNSTVNRSAAAAAIELDRSMNRNDFKRGVE